MGKHRTSIQKSSTTTTTKFRNDLHDKSPLIKMLNTMEICGVCKRCKEIIEWRIRFKKYKPLSVPKKCVKCEQKTIKRAYNVCCEACGEELKICLKCLKPSDDLSVKTKLTPDEEIQQQQALKSDLKLLPERKRRAVLRYMAKGPNKESGQPSTKAISTKASIDPVSDWLDTVLQESISEESLSDTESSENGVEETDEIQLDVKLPPLAQTDNQKTVHADNCLTFKTLNLDELSLETTLEAKNTKSGA